jgi:hypothetical protein
MSEYDDDLVRTAFQRFEVDARPHLPLPDRTGVRAIARRRSVERTVVLAAVVLALVLPMAAFAALREDRRSPAPAESLTPTAIGSTSPSIEPPPSATPSATPSAQSWLTKDQLKRATINLPAWGPGAMAGKCPKDRVKLADLEQYTDTRPMVLIIGELLFMDVNGDSDAEAVANLFCGFQGGDQQIVVFERGPGGAPVTLGQVVATGEQTPIKTFFGMRVEPDGVLGVQIGDTYQCCGADERLSVHQWRGYRWNGRRFVQVTGSTSVPPKPSTVANVNVTASTTTLALGAPANGVRRGTVTVTARNTGPVAAEGVWVEARLVASFGKELAAPIQITTTSTSGCTVDMSVLVCHAARIPVNGTASYTFTFTSPVANDVRLRPEGRWSVLASPEQPGVRMLVNPGDRPNVTASGPVTLA